ncbi:MAG: hypothetical protein ACRD8K_08595 [Nitrososphaeraceae archaeon]
MRKKNQPNTKSNTSFTENNKLSPNTIKQRKPREDNTFTKDLTSNTKTLNDIIDIDDSPDVATWNKEVTRYKDHITKNSIISEETNEKYRITNSPEIPPTTTIGLRKENNDNEDDQVDPANQQDLNEIFNSGSKLTDKANLFNSKRKFDKSQQYKDDNT